MRDSSRDSSSTVSALTQSCLSQFVSVCPAVRLCSPVRLFATFSLSLRFAAFYVKLARAACIRYFCPSVLAGTKQMPQVNNEMKEGVKEKAM